MPLHDRSRWRAEADALFARAARLSDAHARARAFTDAGDVLRDAAADPVEASRCYLAAVEAAPDAAEAALSRLDQLTRTATDVEITANLISALSRARRWPEVVAQLERQAETVDAPDERAGLLLAAAMTARRRLGGEADGRRALLAAAQCAGPETRGEVLTELEARLSLAPGDAALAVSAARLHVAEGRNASAFRLLESTAGRVTAAAARGSLLLDAAILAADALSAPLDAARLLVAATTADPNLRAAVELRLEALIAHAGGDGELTAVLTTHFQTQGDEARLSATLARAAEGGDPATRAARRLAVARHAEQALAEPARAFELFRDGLLRGEGDLADFAAGMRRTGALGVPGALPVMTELFERLALWGPLVGALEDAADVAADDAERAALLFRAGEILEKHQDDLEEAMRCYVRAFQTQPAEGRYLAAGERVYRRRGEWRMVDRLLGLQVRVAGEAGLRRRLLEEQARVRHRQLGDALGAYEALRAALAQGGADITRRVLRDLVCDDGAFNLIEEGLRRRAREEGGATAARLYLEVAALQIDVRGKPVDGAAALQAAADATPEDVALFETVRDRIAQLGDEARLARWLGRAHRRPLPLQARVDALRLSGQLHLEAGRPAEAVAPLREAVRLMPRAEASLRLALEAAAAAEDPPAEIALLEGALDGEIGPVAAPRLDRLVWLRRLARLKGANGDSAGAEAALHTILAMDPLDDAAFQDIEMLHLAAGDDVALMALYRQRLAALDAADTPPPTELLRTVLALSEGPGGDPALATDCAQRLLARDAADPAARRALHALFAATGDREGRLKLLRLELADVDEPVRRADIAETLAALAVEEPMDAEALVIARQVLVDLAPRDLAALDALAVALQGADRVAEMAEVLGRRWALAPVAEHLGVLRAQAMALQTLGDHAGAAQAWRDVLAHDPADDRVLESLQRIAAAQGDHETVYALYWRRHDIRSDPAQAVALLADAATVAERGLKDADRAAAAWRRVLGWLPEDPAAERALLRLYTKARDWPALMALGQARLERLAGEERLALAQQLARLAQDGAADEDTALALWQVVRAEAPQDREALEALIDAAERRRDPVAGARLLGALVEATSNAQDRRLAMERRAAVLESMGDLAGAAEVWGALRSLTPNDRAPVTAARRLALAQGDDYAAAQALATELRFVQAPAEALALNQQLAHISERLGDQLGGAAAWERVRSLAGPGGEGEAEALHALKRLYADLGRTEELLRVVRALMERAPDDPTRVAHLIDAADLLERLRGDFAEAFECRVRAWRLTPEPPPDALVALRRLAAAGDLWAELAEVLGVAQARAGSVAEEEALLLERATIEADALGAPDRALASALSAFELAPRDGAAFEAVVQYAEATESWAVWVDALRAVAPRVDRARQGALLLQAAQLTQAHLEDAEGAFELYAEAAEVGAAGADDGLFACAEAQQRWPEVIDRYAAWRDAAQTPEAKVALMRRLAHALEHGAGDATKAFEQHLLALQIDPHDGQTRAEVWRLAEAIDGWSYVARVLALKARETSRPGARVALLRLLAEVHSTHLDEPARALETLQRAFSADPADGELRAALRALASERSMGRTVAALFEEEAGWVEARPDRLALLREAAALYAEAGVPSEAARLHGRVLELAPEAEGALEALLSLRRGAGDPVALAADLERLSRKGEPEQRIALLEELAGLYRGPLAAPAKAEDVYRRLLVLRGGDDATFEALVATLTGRSAWRALDEAYERRARDAKGEARLDLLRRRAELLRGRLGQTRQAFELLVEVAQAHPEDVELLMTLADQAGPADAHSLLLACAERTAAVVGPEALADVLVLIGRVARDRFGNDKKARKVLLRALELRPDDVALAREVAGLLTARRQHGDLVALHERVGPALLAEGDEAPDAPAVVARWALALSALKAEQLYDYDGAIEVLTGLVATQPDRVEAWRRLAGLGRRAQAGAVIVQAAERLAALAPDDAVAALEDAAQALARLGDAERSVAMWQAVLARAPEHDEALQGVRRFAERQADWGLLATQLAARAEATAAPAPVWAELGRLQRDQVQDPAAAQAAFEAALAADPDDAEALEALVALAQVDPAAPDVARLAALTAHAEARLAAHGDAAPEGLRALVADQLLAAATRAEAAGDTVAQRGALSRAHAAAPDRDDVAVALADALVDADALPEAAALYGDRPLPPIKGRGAANRKAAAHLRRARAFRAVGDAARALRHFEVAAQRPNTRCEALDALAALQAEAGRWEAAVRLKVKYAEAVTDVALQGEALAEAGRLAEDRLGKPTRALRLYRQAVEAGVETPALLRRLLDLLVDLRRADEALPLATRLLAHPRLVDPNQRAEVLTVQGQLLADAGQVAEAIAAWRSALEASPLLIGAVEGLLTHLDDAAPDAQRAILRQIHGGVDLHGAGPHGTRVLERLGRRLMARGDSGGALEVYEALLARAPDHVGARAALARLHGALAEDRTVPDGTDLAEEAAHIERALTHHLAYVSARPGEANALGELSQLLTRLGRPAALHSIERLTAWVEGAPAEPPLVSPLMTLSEGARHALVGDDPWRLPLGVLVRALHGWIGADVAAVLGRPDPRPRPAVPAPVALEIATLTDALGLTPRAWVSAPGPSPVHCVTFAPLTLGVRPDLGAGDPVARRFHLARALEASRGPAAWVGVGPVDEVHAIVSAALALSLGEDGHDFELAGGADAERIAVWGERLLTWLPEGKLDALARLSRPVLATGEDAFVRWVAAVQRLATRMGFVMAGDLRVALEVLADEAGLRAPTRLADGAAWQAFFQAVPAAEALYQYAFGTRYGQHLVHG